MQLLTGGAERGGPQPASARGEAGLGEAVPVPLDCDAQGSSGQQARRWGGPEDSDRKGSLGRALVSEDQGSQPASLRVPENPGRFLSECFGALLEGGVSPCPSPTPRGCVGGVTRGGGAGEGSVSSGNPSGPRWESGHYPQSDRGPGTTPPVPGQRGKSWFKGG